MSDKPKADEPSDQEITDWWNDLNTASPYWHLRIIPFGRRVWRECRERTLEEAASVVQLEKYGTAVRVRSNPSMEEQNLAANWGDEICRRVEKAIRALAARKES